MDWQALDQLAAKLMKNRASHRERERGFIYYHGKRVAAGALELRRRLFPQDDSGDDALRLAAMFHDLGKGLSPHGRYGAVLLREAVRDIVPQALAERAADMVAVHPMRQSGTSPYDIWTQLLQDADLLDHSGCYGVWMNAQFYSVFEGDMLAGLEYSESHLESFWQENEPLCNFTLSRRILRDKLDAEKAFFARARYEANGLYAPLPDEK